jgi:DNA-binding Xre family transcriptional regulator
VLVAQRLAAGMTRSNLAAKAGVSTNTLMKVVQGKTQDPGVLKVAALCHALRVSIDDLVREAVRTPSPQEVPMSHGIVSVGYEGRTIEAFVADLQRVGVRTVADVRLNAVSRKAGFSKTRLKEALAAAGIGYRHLRSLGNAKENRQPFWDGRVEEGRRVFRESLRSPEAESSLQELASLAADEVVAVLCFESDMEVCHRKVIIDEVIDAAPVPLVALPC